MHYLAHTRRGLRKLCTSWDIIRKLWPLVTYSLGSSNILREACETFATDGTTYGQTPASATGNGSGNAHCSHPVIEVLCLRSILWAAKQFYIINILLMITIVRWKCIGKLSLANAVSSMTHVTNSPHLISPLCCPHAGLQVALPILT